MDRRDKFLQKAQQRTTQKLKTKRNLRDNAYCRSIGGGLVAV